jgi:pimeloyl-ACP methyl ester carboxylesterase
VRIECAASDPFTTHEVLAAIHGTPLRSKRVVVQRYGETNRELQAALESEGADVTEITTYRWGLPEWSGKNNHADRVAGAEELAAFLRSCIARNSSSKVFLICHSHGGNVALLALSDKELQKNISGVICLGTPFLHVFRRGPTNILNLPVAIVAAASLFLYYPTLRAIVNGFQFSTVAIGVLGVLLAVFAFLLRWLFEKFFRDNRPGRFSIRDRRLGRTASRTRKIRSPIAPRHCYCS